MATHSKMFSFDPNKKQWTSYTERLDFYFETNNFTSAGTKRTILVSGPSTFQLLKSLVQPSTPKEKIYTELKVYLEKHFNPKLSLIVQRFKFNIRIRKSGESVATYVTELRTIGEHGDFGDKLGLMIRERLKIAQ